MPKNLDRLLDIFDNLAECREQAGGRISKRDLRILNVLARKIIRILEKYIEDDSFVEGSFLERRNSYVECSAARRDLEEAVDGQNVENTENGPAQVKSEGRKVLATLYDNQKHRESVLERLNVKKHSGVTRISNNADKENDDSFLKISSKDDQNFFHENKPGKTQEHFRDSKTMSPVRLMQPKIVFKADVSEMSDVYYEDQPIDVEDEDGEMEETVIIHQPVSTPVINSKIEDNLRTIEGKLIKNEKPFSEIDPGKCVETQPLVKSCFVSLDKENVSEMLRKNGLVMFSPKNFTAKVCSPDIFGTSCSSKGSKFEFNNQSTNNKRFIHLRGSNFVQFSENFTFLRSEYLRYPEKELSTRIDRQIWMNRCRCYLRKRTRYK